MRRRASSSFRMAAGTMECESEDSWTTVRKNQQRAPAPLGRTPLIWAKSSVLPAMATASSSRLSRLRLVLSSTFPSAVVSVRPAPSGGALFYIGTESKLESAEVCEYELDIQWS